MVCPLILDSGDSILIWLVAANIFIHPWVALPGIPGPKHPRKNIAISTILGRTQLKGTSDGGDWLASHCSHFTDEKPWYPLDRWLGGSHSQSGHCGEQKNPTLPGIDPQLSNLQPSYYICEKNPSINKHAGNCLW